MNSRVVGTGIIAALLGLAGGFLIANSFNRSTLTALKTQLDTRNTSSNTNTAKPDELGVSNEEIRSKIAEADANPSDLTYQKNLGRGLYRFATMKKDAELLKEAKRLLIRANSLDAKDYDVLVDLGNAHFDAGYFNKDAASFKLARETYEKAFVIKPEDADVRTDFGLTYFLDEPADLKRAIDEFQRALKINPKQERALQFLTATYIRQSDFASAQKTLDTLKATNAKNDSIPSLATQIESQTYTPAQ